MSTLEDKGKKNKNMPRSAVRYINSFINSLKEKV